ncbi:MAG: hypothetical protein L0206_19505, partial [Actinobacteria bacterium]|nr:hypothetical protein [Actinomycetota bacterium]
MRTYEAALWCFLGAILLFVTALACRQDGTQNIVQILPTRNDNTVEVTGFTGTTNKVEIVAVAQTSGAPVSDVRATFSPGPPIAVNEAESATTEALVQKADEVAGVESFEFSQGFVTNPLFFKNDRIDAVFNVAGADREARFAIFTREQLAGTVPVDPLQVQTVDLEALPAKVDDRLSAGNMDFVFDATPRPGAPQGTLTIFQSFQNSGAEPLYDTFQYVLSLGDGLAVLNGDGGPGGTGTRVTPPEGTEVAPGGSFTATLVLGLQGSARRRISFTNVGFVGARPEPPEEELDLRIVNVTDGSITAEPTMTIETTATGSVTLLDVNGIESALAPGGGFEATVPLFEGLNVLRATAESETDVATDAVLVVRDTRAPKFEIVTPRSGELSANPNWIFAGTAIDERAFTDGGAIRITLSIGGELVSETLAGPSGSFAFPGVTLPEGESIVDFTGTDAAGNATSTPFIVIVDPALPGPRALVVSGDGQAGEVGTTLPSPLVFQVTDDEGNALPHHPVEVRVEGGDGKLELEGSLEASGSTLLTDDGGTVSLSFVLGTQAGDRNQLIRALPLGGLSSAVASASATPGPAAAIHRSGPLADTAAAGERIPGGVSFRVTDRFGNPAPGTNILAELSDGGGTFADGLTVTSTAAGVFGTATFDLTLASTAGDTTITANFPGNTGFPATAAVRRVAIGRIADTRAVLQVSDGQLDAVEGSTVTYLGTGLTVVTNSEGYADLELSPGEARFVIDGSAANNPTAGVFFGNSSARGDILPGVTNRLSVIVPGAGDPAAGTTVGGPADTTFAIGEGAFVISGGTLTVNGSPAQVTMGAGLAPLDRLLGLPQGDRPYFAFTLEDFTGEASSAVRYQSSATIPNLGELPPGAEAPLLYFDLEIGGWVDGGRARVSEDGADLVVEGALSIDRPGTWVVVGPPDPLASISHTPSGEPGTVALPEGTPVVIGNTLLAAGADGSFGGTVPSFGSDAGTVFPIRARALVAGAGVQTDFFELAPIVATSTAAFVPIAAEPATIRVNLRAPALDFTPGATVMLAVD